MLLWDVTSRAVTWKNCKAPNDQVLGFSRSLNQRLWGFLVQAFTVLSHFLKSAQMSTYLIYKKKPTCSPNMLLDVWLEGHAVQFSSAGCCWRILDANSRSERLSAKDQSASSPSCHHPSSILHWKLAHSIISSLELVLITQHLVKDCCLTLHQHQRRQSWNPAGVGGNSGPWPTYVIHLFANIVLWVSLKA